MPFDTDSLTLQFWPFPLRKVMIISLFWLRLSVVCINWNSANRVNLQKVMKKLNHFQFFMVFAQDKQHAIQQLHFIMLLINYQQQVSREISFRSLNNWIKSIFLWFRSANSSYGIMCSKWRWSWGILCVGLSKQYGVIYNELFHWPSYLNWTERKLHGTTNFDQFYWSI